MTIIEFSAAIQALAERDGATDPGVAYCEPEAWQDALAAGLTPAEAWAEEVSIAAADGAA
jgi:hypothetical protein